MPSFKNISAKKLDLPNSKDKPEAEKAWVKIRTNITSGDVRAVNEAELDRKNIVLMARLIVDWNYEDDGQQTPITEETIDTLELEDYNFILTETTGIFVAATKKAEEALNNDEKKVLSASSPEATAQDQTPTSQVTTATIQG